MCLPSQISPQVSTVISKEFAGGVSYDPASQVTNILHQLTATSTPINTADYVYNNVGNRTCGRTFHCSSSCVSYHTF